MIRYTELRLAPDKAYDQNFIESLLRRENRIVKNQQFDFRLIKRSIDARKKKPVYLLRFKVYIDELHENEQFEPNYNKVDGNRKVIIVGAGPAGLFSALKLIESGIKPILIERGKDVRARRKDLAEISKNHIVNPDSNYCFGEGGAGTYSDGKLYTRSKKKGNVNEMLKRLVYFGAPEQILTDAHPHIGTNKLPGLIQNIRETIIKSGGEFHFNERVVDLELQGKKIKAIITQSGNSFTGESVILATGHSASDIYRY